MLGLGVAGCAEGTGAYIAASQISNNGFAGDATEIGNAHGREIKLWGFVDHGNIYGDDDVKRILGDFWGGLGPSASMWRFDLKGKGDDETGHSFSVYVPNDAGRDAILEAFFADAKNGRGTRVFLKGRIFAFDAPVNTTTFTGLYMQLRSSQDILLELPKEK
jgi:hypothetical protein